MYLKWSENPKHDPTVESIQRLLNRAYNNTPEELRKKFSWPYLKEDGYFGKATAAAVWAFQNTRQNPLNAPEYGVVGDTTWSALCNFYNGPMISVAPKATLFDKARTQLRIWKMEYPESCKSNFIKVLSLALDSIKYEDGKWLNQCVSQKKWRELTDVYNAKLSVHDSKYKQLQRDLADAEKEYGKRVEIQKSIYRNRNNTDSGLYYEKKGSNSRILEGSSIKIESIKIEQNKREIKIKLSPEKLKSKIAGASGKVSTMLSWIEPTKYAWKLFLQYSVPESARNAEWDKERNHVLGQLIDSIINVVVGILITNCAVAVVATATAAATATALTAGLTIAAVIIVGMVIGFIIDYLFDLLDANYFNDHNLTGLERFQKYKQKNAKIYVDWAQAQNYTV